MQEGQTFEPSAKLPSWVPVSARHYLAHTEAGLSIRALARENDCHPSTILRQIRKFENSRDDPLIDNALRELSAILKKDRQRGQGETKSIKVVPVNDREELDGAQIEAEAKRILRRLCEPGSVMAVAREMETAVIVRETEDGESLRTAVVDRQIAQAIALKGWVSCTDPTAKIVRYVITNSGRAAIRELTARDENRASGFSDARSTFDGATAWNPLDLDPSAQGKQGRSTSIESPLVGLSRRRDKTGAPFLAKELVAAGERLREDFELAKMGRKVSRDVDEFLDHAALADAPKGAVGGLERTQAALRDIGPGLADVVYQCCCLLEGLEHTEKSMGWSARSGKIVLRIALERLAVHYASLGKFAPMIG